MALNSLRFLSAIFVVLVCATLPAQDPAEADVPVKSERQKKKLPEPEKPRDISYLSKPLSDIRTNILDIEREGYFAVQSVDFRTRGTGDEAIVWTIRVRRTVTCRHVEAMLREYRDARFYQTINDSKFEIIATLVNYSDRISIGASNGKLFRQDDVFDFWINVPTGYFQRLKSLDADTLVLRRWRY
ncbi:MAG: hypothetical protein H6822_07625 [Planctomycetaceae bacterium]|nr:hypothetical protein [Planctomycetales bacterium]MCB9922034.1 hypothetical protein [Planctomycetaceae bacterium]